MASCFGNIGTVFQSPGQYDRNKIGDREGEATNYEKIGSVFHSLRQFDKAKEYLQKRVPSNLKLLTEKEKHHFMET